MKVLLINGSPDEKGCTYTALCEVAGELMRAGLDTELIQLGHKPIQGCMDCGWCRHNQAGRCAYNEDPVNLALEKAREADGFIFGSPVHYAAPSGSITSFLDRFFFAGQGFGYKPGACVVSCRRGGATAAFDALNKYFTISNMPVVPSSYWNMVHGMTPEEVLQDLEGMQVMRNLGRNMAWMLRCIEAGKKAGIALPERETPIATNFIR